MRKLINLINRKIAAMLGTSRIKDIYDETVAIRSVFEHVTVDNYLREQLFTNAAYTETKKITHFHLSVFSQNGEDGVIREIFKRIGTTDKFFVEFGVHGVKNNSTFLLVEGWQGLWIGGDENGKQIVDGKFSRLVKDGKLKHALTWISRENIEDIFAKQNVPFEFDFLSIDLDGNDYWIWQAIRKYRPRVVCIEYNATFPAGTSWVMEYRSDHVWDATSYFGASLKALEKLGKEKGYELVGCDFSGCNAFFVRNDQNLAAFESPFTAEHHYEPPRYFIGLPNGHTPGFGPFTTP